MDEGALTHGTQLALRALSIVRDGDEFLVGDPGRGQFVALSEVGVCALEGITTANSLRDAHETVLGKTGESVDMVEFAQTLLELGFVESIDGVPLEAPPPQMRDGGQAGAFLARVARPLFSRWAWIAYGGVLAACITMFIVNPRYWPSAGDLFFLHGEPVESTAVIAVLALGFVAAHEMMHWLAARVEGVPSRIAVGRRAYVLVLETDLTALFALPRRRRFAPLLAGMAFDTVTLALLLAARVCCGALWHEPAVIVRLLSALILTRVIGLAFQFLVFLRTDLYAVIAIGLRCRNLSRVSGLMLKRRLAKLTIEEAEELDEAGPTDLRVAGYFQWIRLAGMAAATWLLIAYIVPWTLTLAQWTTSKLTHESPDTITFWEALMFGVLALTPRLLPLLLFVRDQRSRLRRRRHCDRGGEKVVSRITRTPQL